jgi:hypothetical protein
VEQMGKIDPENWVKIIILEKWLIATSNWKRYKYPPIAAPNLGVNLTSFKHHEPLFHNHHELLNQIDED